MQNSKTCSFSHFQPNLGCTNLYSPPKIICPSLNELPDSNPKKQKVYYGLQMDNMMVSGCQLIANYPESQEHTEQNPIEETIIEKVEEQEESHVQCNDCIDIESIMNQNHTNIILTYNANNFKEVDQKLAPTAVHKDCEAQQYKERDETKNVPKNYIKAIFSFILQNPVLVRKILMKNRNQIESCELNRFLDYIRAEKKCKVYTIARLKEIWLEQGYGKILRIVYSHFLRKRAFQYVYSSKIENKVSHVKYRCNLLRALQNPMQFNSFK